MVDAPGAEPVDLKPFPPQALPRSFRARSDLPERQSFAQFLIGTAALERPSFLYAYLVMWLHLLVSVPVLVFLVEVPLLDALPQMAISSPSLGILLYGLSSKRYGFLVNLLPYAVGLRRAIDPAALDYTFLLLAVIICLTSTYLLLSEEYRLYTSEQVEGERGLSLRITLSVAAAILLLLLYGLHLQAR